MMQIFWHVRWLAGILLLMATGLACGINPQQPKAGQLKQTEHYIQQGAIT